MQNKKRIKPRPAAAGTSGNPIKKNKAKNLKPSIFLMIFYWIMAVLLGLGIYAKGKHFFDSHWNKNIKIDSNANNPQSVKPQKK